MNDMVVPPIMNNLSTKFSDNYEVKDELGKYVTIIIIYLQM